MFDWRASFPAIDLCPQEMQLVNGSELTNEIIAAQEKETAFLKGWLEKNAN
ncbi:MAG: hypothetical protein ACRECW_05070 [Phyllobacterium sp.]